MNLTELKEKSVSELLKLAESMKLEHLARSRKQDIIFAILKALRLLACYAWLLLNQG